MVEQIAAVGGALSALKTISDIAKNVNSIELTQKIIELQSSILEMQRNLNEKSEEIHSLKAKILELDRSQATDTDLEWQEDGGFWLRKSEKAQGLFIPYCPACWGTAAQLVPLTEQMSVGSFACTIHKSRHVTQAYHEAEKRRIERSRADESAFAIIPGPNSWMR